MACFFYILTSLSTFSLKDLVVTTIRRWQWLIFLNLSIENQNILQRIVKLFGIPLLLNFVKWGDFWNFLVTAVIANFWIHSRKFIDLKIPKSLKIFESDRLEHFPYKARSFLHILLCKVFSVFCFKNFLIDPVKLKLCFHKKG